MASSATEKTLPDGPFFAEGVDVTKALAKADDLGVTENDHNMNAPILRAILKAALVGVEPALMEGWCPRGGGHTDGPDQEGDCGVCGSKWAKVRLVTDWGEIR